MVFFLLSGFVIEYSSHRNPDATFGFYFKRRFIRIYPVFLTALVISALFASGASEDSRSFQALVGNLFLIQDLSWAKPGVTIPTYCDNYPLWSLSYEWWFYMLFFPLQKWLRPGMQITVVGLISLSGVLTLLIQPRQFGYFLAYFSIWWLGVELARAHQEKWKSWKNLGISLTQVATMGAIFILWTIADYRNGRPLDPGIFPALSARHFLGSIVILAFAWGWRKVGWQGFNFLLSPFAHVAPFSYALYVFHFPLLRGTFNQPAGTQGVAILAFGGMAVLLAIFFEGPAQKFVNRRVFGFDKRNLETSRPA